MPGLPPAVAVPVPAPYGGINLRDGVAALQPFEARDLVNWEPNGSSVKPRQGKTLFSTAAAQTSPVKTLAIWASPATSKLVGVAAGIVYDFSSTNATVIYNTVPYTESRWQTECYSSYLIAVNGVDLPWTYDGTTFNTASGFTGLTLTNLINVRMVHNRLWFCEKDKAWAWYGAVAAITGALTKFDLSQVVTDGYLVAVGAHSQDAGVGADDLTCFVMSSGLVTVYSGDPAETFSKIGTFNLGARPIGRDCIFQVGGALHVITTLGVIPLSIAMQSSTMNWGILGPYGKAGPGLKRYSDLYKANVGWFMRTWQGRLIVNVPVVNQLTSVQWVMNTQGGAWGRWEGFNMASLVEWNGVPYYGDWGAGKVYKINGTDDLGSSITLTSRGACVAFFQNKQCVLTAIRFDMAITGSFSGRFGVDDDYLTRPFDGATQVLASSTATTPWGSAWSSAWGSSSVDKGLWFGAYGEGRALGIAVEASTTATECEWYGTEVLVQGLSAGV